MTTRIGVVSDIHSAVKPLQAALELFQKKQVDHVICLGDIAGYGEDELIQVVGLLQQQNCLCILGNHDQLAEDVTEQPYPEEVEHFFNQLPGSLSLQIENKKIYMVHASPPEEQHGGIKLLDQNGELIPEQIQYWSDELRDFDHDILLVGHTHQVFIQRFGETLVINPGSTLFNHSCVILTLPEMKTEVLALEGKEMIRSWNWGLFYIEQNKKRADR